ncbi:PLP-dependent aminotransferase family protein [Kibdelosporangium persicum]|uniref:Hydroxyphenylglycine aminotransferase n=1 Tax=Kibdelosporangium persicum TaxID=2698649 RepID=A0ABX2FJ16_9PSEU|nr:PLP-dependent aminotransferase family protein [Kibdelosporangium persicum]NRN70862.1 Hydroxyphenylglycine aminotransferase [Kibdelosporangium persicum]
MTTTTAGRVPMSTADLHAAVADPVLSSMNFLNEVMDRYPDAISMAPGAPHESFFADMDIGRYVGAFSRHLESRGLGEAAIRRVLYQYGPSRGQINDIIAEALRRDEGLDVRPESLVITVGAQEAIFLTLRVLHREPGDAIAVVDPCYPGVLGAARLLDIPVVPVAGTADGFDLDQLRQVGVAYRQRGRRVRTLYVAPDFANPGGARIPLPARRMLLDEADRLDLTIIEDNTYGFTAAADDRLPSLKSLDERGRVVHVGTFAKICLPGARVGYLIADQQVHGTTTAHLLADDITSAKSMITVNTSPISQALIAGMLLEHGGSLLSVASAKARLYRRNLTVLLESMDRHIDRSTGISWNEPDGGFFVRLRLPVPVDDALLERCARGYGVIWTPMRHFHLGTGGDNQLRLSCSSLSEAQIEEGVLRLAGFLRDVTEER